MPELNDLLLKCAPIVQKAGQIVAQNWNLPHAIEHKGAIDLVTETDKAVEAFLAAALKAVLPDANFLGEERPGEMASLLASELCWVVDPVDGTTNFVHRIPAVGVSVALCSYGQPVLGIVDCPMLDECYTAVKGAGACLNNEAIHVSKTGELIQALIGTGFPYEPAPQLPAILKRLERILPATQGLRRIGAASLDLCYVACGKLDAFYEDGLKPWDMAAGWLIVNEAGGQLTDFTGGEAGWHKSLAASNGLIHDSLIELLKPEA